MNHSHHTPASNRTRRLTRKERQRASGIGPSIASPAVRKALSRLTSGKTPVRDSAGKIVAVRGVSWTPYHSGATRSSRHARAERDRLLKLASDAVRRDNHLARVALGRRPSSITQAEAEAMERIARRRAGA